MSKPWVWCGSWRVYCSRRLLPNSNVWLCGSRESHLQNHVSQRENLYWQGPDDTLTYFDSVNSALVAADFTAGQRRDLMIRKEILWESETATDSEVSGQANTTYTRHARTLYVRTVL